MFVIVFPQLTLVLYWELANTYGSVMSFIIGIILRLLCGDSLMGIAPTISFGTVYGEEGSCPTDEDPLAACTGPVPFRLIVMIIGTVSSKKLFFITTCNLLFPVGPLHIQLWSLHSVRQGVGIPGLRLLQLLQARPEWRGEENNWHSL